MNEQLVLGLLIFIAVEAIIVNIGYLENLEDFAEQMKVKIITPGLDVLFAPRDGRFDLTDYAEDAKEVLVCGVSLAGFAMSQTNVLTQLAAKEIQIVEEATKQ